jgi:2'-5' RNA ligase
MDIKKALREALEEKAKPHRKHVYGCVMVYLKVDEKEWEALQSKIDEKDIYNGEEGAEGGFAREYDPHATILFGLHDDVPDEDVEKVIDAMTEPDIEMQKISSFNNEQFDVLKFDVESSDLNKYNKEMSKLPHTNKFPDYHPHVTIAYLKKGTAAKYVKEFAKIKPIEVEVDKIVYSKVDGSKKNYKIK